MKKIVLKINLLDKAKIFGIFFYYPLANNGFVTSLQHYSYISGIVITIKAFK